MFGYLHYESSLGVCCGGVCRGLCLGRLFLRGGGFGGCAGHGLLVLEVGEVYYGEWPFCLFGFLGLVVLGIISIVVAVSVVYFFLHVVGHIVVGIGLHGVGDGHFHLAGAVFYGIHQLAYEVYGSGTYESHEYYGREYERDGEPWGAYHVLKSLHAV